MAGILAYGAYIPRLRLARKTIVSETSWFMGSAAKVTGERSMCNWDEDTVTMAVEAARDCLTGFNRDEVGGVHLASTTFPFADRLNAAIVAQALTLKPEIAALDLASSQRAATSALMASLLSAGNSGEATLTIGSDKRRTRSAGTLELSYGDGAAAFLTGEGPVIARLIGHASNTVDFVDHYRGQGATYDYQWEERWSRDEGYMKLISPVIMRACEAADTAPHSIVHFCMPTPAQRLATAIARSAGIPKEAVRDNLEGECGDTGVAHPLLLLADALAVARPGERILLVGYGQGCDVLLFEVTEQIRSITARLGVRGHLAVRREQKSYHKFLAFNDVTEIERGLRSELDKQTALSALYRKRAMLTGLVGGRCTDCGTAQFPKSNVCVNPDCNSFHTQGDQPFADAPGAVLYHTADRLTYSPDPPSCFGMVQFEQGGRMLADFTDMDEADVHVGMAVRMVFRVSACDSLRRFTRYFWKAAPANAAEGS